MTTLKDYARRHLISSVIIPLVVVYAVVFVIYYIQSQLIKQDEKDYFIHQARESIKFILDDKVEDIENDLIDIENTLTNLHYLQEYYYANEEQFNIPDATFKFEKSAKGFLYKDEKFGGSDVVFMPQAKPTAAELTQAYKLEHFDPMIRLIVTQNDHLEAAWLNQENYLVRYYPYFGMKDVLMPDMNLKKFNFYYEADPQHNPQRKHLWTSLYLDPAMKGWMISRIAPLYKNGEFIGVSGLDMPIKNMANKLLGAYSQWSIEMFITDEQGNILAMNQNMQLFFDYISLADYTDGSSLLFEVLQPEEYNILKSNELIQKQFAPFFTQSEVIDYVNYKEKHFLAASKNIEQTQWKLFFLIDEAEVLGSMQMIENNTQKIALSTLFIFSVLGVIVLIFLFKRFNDFAVKITEPIIALTYRTKNFKEKQGTFQSDLSEIETLNENFNIMIDEISRYQNELESRVNERTVELKNKIDTIETLQVQLLEQNIRDSLTNLFNRRYFAKAGNREIANSIKEKNRVAFVMIDLDNFKTINDQYGHQYGDEVLIRLSRILGKNIRRRDIAIRYGGEEFLLILPNTTTAKAYELVEKIRKIYEHEMQTFKNIEINSTFSAGIALFPDDADTLDALVKLADDMLYDVKKSGKNRVKIRSS